MDEQEISWRAPEFFHYEKSVYWHAAVAVVAIAIAIVAFFQRNFLFAVFALVSGGLMMYWGHQKPEMLTFTLSEKGLDISGRTFYPWEDLTGFTLLVSDGDGELVLRTKKKLNTYLKIIIPKEFEEEIAASIAAHVSEMEYEEPLTERISHWLRF